MNVRRQCVCVCVKALNSYLLVQNKNISFFSKICKYRTVANFDLHEQAYNESGSADRQLAVPWKLYLYLQHIVL